MFLSHLFIEFFKVSGTWEQQIQTNNIPTNRREQRVFSFGNYDEEIQVRRNRPAERERKAAAQKWNVFGNSCGRHCWLSGCAFSSPIFPPSIWLECAHLQQWQHLTWLATLVCLGNSLGTEQLKFIGFCINLLQGGRDITLMRFLLFCLRCLSGSSTTLKFPFILYRG